MDEEFVHAVRKNAELYDKGNKYYQDSARKEFVWQTLGKQFNLKDPKAKWFDIRHKYVKWKKKHGQTGKAYTWSLYKHLVFLDDHLTHRKKTCVKDNILNEENGSFEKVTKFQEDEFPNYSECENPLKDEWHTVTLNSNYENSKKRKAESVGIDSLMETIINTNNVAGLEDEDWYFLQSIRMEMKHVSLEHKTDLKIEILMKVREYRKKSRETHQET